MKETSHSPDPTSVLAKKPKKKRGGLNLRNSSRWKEVSVIEGRGTPLDISESVEGEGPSSWRARCTIRPLNLNAAEEEEEEEEEDCTNRSAPMADSEKMTREDVVSLRLNLLS